ncbi:MAG: phosphoglycerate mutase, partial [Clostridia bacterium]|nr:phosphoglycerate mutase [Clostridia bacterium]
RPVFDYLARCGEDYKIMILPDHPTPICTRTHAMDPVPFLIYDSANEHESGVDRLDEEHAASTGLYVESGYKLLDMMIAKRN